MPSLERVYAGPKTAVVTGAGSGVGQAVAISLARQGWRVAIVGRRAEALKQTVELAGSDGKQLLVISCDIGNHDDVTRMSKAVFEKFGSVEVLVNAAGTNAPNRSLKDLSSEDYHQMINTNLHGAYYCTQAFLPAMREKKTGTIVHIVSDAGKQASPKAGPAYAMSKFGLAGLTQSINAEERGNGVRASAIFPGDIDTPLLERRPSPPGAEARAKMLRAEDVAECVLLAIYLPSHAIVEELIIRPR
jgi:NAD(P)-dependent dehydrogenase (short-subunit alcohol dehydrogenase family)